MVADEFSSYRIPGCESSQGRIVVLCLTHNFITILLQLMLRKCGRMSFSLCAYLVSMFGGDGIRSFIYTVLLLELSSLFWYHLSLDSCLNWQIPIQLSKKLFKPTPSVPMPHMYLLRLNLASPSFEDTTTRSPNTSIHT
jgi:hypothetical protein